MRRALAGAALALTATACATISTQQEVQMGADYARQINAQLPIVNDPEVNRYINVLGDSIARLSDDRNLQWHFYVVNSDEVNAFAVPGGHVYVNRGLIARADKMDQLAGVLGHEIGHVTQRHSVKMMEKQQGAQVGLALGCILTRVCDSQAAGAAINLGAGAVFAKFSREAEAEADQAAITHVMRAGISPRGLPEMFRTLLEERRQRPGGVESWFATHPLEEDRIAATQATIDRIQPAILASLDEDSPNFHAFKARVAALPPASGRGGR